MHSDGIRLCGNGASDRDLQYFLKILLKIMKNTCNFHLDSNQFLVSSFASVGAILLYYSNPI